MNTVLYKCKKLSAGILVISHLVFANISHSQVLKESSPETAGLSSERLSRIDKLIQGYVDSKQISGATAIVVSHGKIVYYKGIGLDDTDSKSPLKKDAIFRIASQTKAVTSVAVMTLYEEGKFLLDDPISKYIQSFKDPKVLDKFNADDSSYTTKPASREITIRDLLTHTSGISYAGIGGKEAVAIYAKNKIPSGIGTPDYNLGESITALGKLPLMHNPGEKFTYGLNTDVLGYLVEVLSGKTLDVYFRERIFEPLGMKDSYFYLPKEKQSRLVALYSQNKEGALIKSSSAKGFPTDYPNKNGKFYSGGAGLSSTAYDYAIFLQMMLNGGEYDGKRILSPAVVNLMIQNQTGNIMEGGDMFGLGFSIVSEKGAARLPISRNSFEWGGIFGTLYWADPKEKVVALLMTQKYPNSVWGEMQDKFKVMVYQAMAPDSKK